MPQWAHQEWLLHGFSTRVGPADPTCDASHPPDPLEFNLGYLASADREMVASNREAFVQGILGAEREIYPGYGLVTLKQMHSALARRVGLSEIGSGPASLWGDGLVTDQAGVLLGIQTADCLPILIADRKIRAVGALHAGWRGTLKGVVQNGVMLMKKEFGSDPEDLTAAIGPGIGSCCFAVGAEVRKLFAARYSYADELFRADSKLHLDLVEANRRQLIDAGLVSGAIFSLDACTNCHPERFFSYRAEQGKTGRMMAVIGVAHGPSRQQAVAETDAIRKQ